MLQTVTKAPTDVRLNPGQQRAQDMIVEQHHTGGDQALRITGEAGCGKSFLVNALQRQLAELGISVAVLKTGATGMSALNIHGITTSRLLRLGIFQHSHEEIRKLNSRNYIPKDVIVVLDEPYSYNEAHMDQVDVALRACTGVDKLFGGTHTILSGDPCQILPYDGTPWFESDKYSHIPVVEMTDNERHKNDLFFKACLDELRAEIVYEMGKKTKPDSWRAIAHQYVPLDLDIWWEKVLPLIDEINYHADEDMILAPYFNQSQELNIAKQKSLSHGQNEFRYEPHFEGHEPPTIGYEYLKLCEGSRVVHTLNRNELVNGSLGTVVDFKHDPNPKVLVKFDDGKFQWVSEATLTSKSSAPELVGGEWLSTEKKGQTTHIPLMPAFSLTARKVQGLTITNGVVHDSILSLQPHGAQLRKLYTLMSRFPTLDDVRMYAG